MKKLVWWLTMIFVCKNEGCNYAHEYSTLPDDDICPNCNKPGLTRQVMEFKQLVDFDPKRHK